MSEISKKVLKRFLQAGYSGWDPPDEAEDFTPWGDFEEMTDLLPLGMKKYFADPKPKEDGHGRDLIVTLRSEATFGDKTFSGAWIEATAYRGWDEDGDGKYSTDKDIIDYGFWVGGKEFSGSRINQFKAELNKFKNALEKEDPETFKELGFH